MIITKYPHISIRVLDLITKLMSAIFKDQGAGVVMVHLGIIFGNSEKPWMCSLQDLQT